MEAMPQENLIVYRTCDRPKYVEITLPINLERSSKDNFLFLVADNSTDEKEAREVVAPYVDDSYVKFFRASGARIGGPNMINEALTRYGRWMPNLKRVFIVDDDVIVPESLESGETWNDILIEMMEAGWEIVGHPWSNDFRRDYVDKIGGVEGYIYSGIAGGCSAFPFAKYQANPIVQRTKIRGYNEWMVRFSNRKNGYSHRGMMTMQHIDRPTHEHSLRDTEYNDWSDAMYYERFPDRKGQKRPKGLKGSW